MKYIISGRNVDVTDGLREAIYEKLGKLEKYFRPDTTAHVTMSVTKSRQKV
ncbi:MAG: ribosome-associated translation inhibitor RaiA, partial [Lachnospiraceae bacterium]|nr:ribosome-associated translation inhibitor RaiA [Lachnospiraceae bacterium]